MMRRLNLIVAIAFVCDGAAYGVLRLLDRWDLGALAVFIGWFLMAYGLVAQLVFAFSKFRSNSSAEWSDFYALNFAFALLAISTLGISRDQISVIALLAVFGGLAG